MISPLIWLALGTFVVGTEGFVIAGILPAIAADAGISVAQGGTLVTAFSLSYAFGAPVLATLLGEVDRRRILAGTMILFAASNLAAALTSSFLALLLARVVMALSAGLYAATAQATAIALAPPERRARAISVVVGGTTVAVALGAPIGALLATLTGWRGTFAAIAALSAVAAVAILLKIPAHLRGTRIPLRERAMTIVKPGLLPILATTLLAMTGGFSVFTYLAPLAVEGTGLPAVVIPGLLLAWGVGAALGNFIGGQAADRYGARTTATFSVLGLSIILAIISLAAKLLSPALAGPALIVLTVLWGIVGWMLLPAQASRLVALQPASAPVSLSLNASALYLGVALGSVVGGAVINVGTPADLGWTGAVATLLALVIVLATERLPALRRLQDLPEGSVP
ncbi:MFS transporter [Microvirga vignae]|uniref:MFS transporter n=1 Tax=Microvirga vignae TaxID=1225564 RepID=A0A0H1R4Y1_9HYPH|nr:MFS transporter [Microvirga vignae]KLK89831.1 MFS transporter [Microvirga vignae]